MKTSLDPGFDAPMDVIPDATADEGTSDGAGLEEPLNADSAKPVACPPLASVVSLATANRPTSVFSDGTHVYFADSEGGMIQRVPREGGTIVTLANSSSLPCAVAVDANNVYWTETDMPRSDATSAVWMASKWGGVPVPVARMETISTPSRGAFDSLTVAGDGFLYWTSAGSLWRAPPIPGSTPTWISTGSASYARDLASDARGSVYWTDWGLNSINKWDPSTGIMALAERQPLPEGIGLSPDGNTVFWTNSTENVMFTGTQGGPVETLGDTTQRSQTSGVVVDAPNPNNPADLVVYWTEIGNPATIWYRRNGQTCSLSTGEANPVGLFVDDRYVYWPAYADPGAIRRAPKVQ